MTLAARLIVADVIDPSHADWAPVVLRALIRRSQRGGKAA